MQYCKHHSKETTNEYVSAEIWHRIQDVTYQYQAIWNQVPEDNKRHMLSPTIFSSKQLYYQNTIPTSHSKEKRFYSLCNSHCENKNNVRILKEIAPLFDKHKSNANGLENWSIFHSKCGSKTENKYLQCPKKPTCNFITYKHLMRFMCIRWYSNCTFQCPADSKLEQINKELLF